jgi:hypothetical protein
MIEPLMSPNVGPDVEREFGQFLIAWQVVDRELDMALGDVLGVTDETAIAVASSLGTQGKLKVLRTVFADQKSGPLPEDISFEFARLCKATEAANVGRNDIIHGQFVMLGEAFWVKWSGGHKGLAGRGRPLQPGILAEEVREAAEIALAWNNLRAAMDYQRSASGGVPR